MNTSDNHLYGNTYDDYTDTFPGLIESPTTKKKQIQT